MKNAPTDPHELAKAKCVFWEHRLTLAVQEFDHTKKSLVATAQNSLQESQRSGFCSGPPMEEEDAVRLLSGLRQKVKSCQRELERWKTERERTEPVQFQQARALAEESRGLLASFCQRLTEIEI